MSTITEVRPERRRKPQAVRTAALAVARRLLIAGGPGAITLKAIGAELGMSHANLIHHFGSAEALRGQLRDLMLRDLTNNTTTLLEQSGPASLALIVDTVFETYAEGGIGMLMAWAATGAARGATDETAGALRELLAALGRLLDGPDAARRARDMVSLVTLMAFADSLIGKALAETIGGEPAAMRALTTRLLASMALPRASPQT
ncbi:TetR/AcrR family transcriptional regulator [Lichenicoccus sp.]|uniref:TetR/AcrR family transcriptional regulator n=1 Tax=Lichenicoccus sp. TaxID=2781899 RepID=UPI003D12AEE8